MNLDLILYMINANNQLLKQSPAYCVIPYF